MIDPKSLRIGNTVNWCKMPITISMKDLIYLCEMEGKNQDSMSYQPIPLSEQELIRLGFDVSRTVGGFEKWELPNGFKLLDGKHPAFMNFRPVQHVHDLQNLYYSLTGTELTYKVENETIKQ